MNTIACTLVSARKVYTLEGQPQEAFVHADGRVLAVGSTEDLSRYPGVNKQVHLEGFVLPGFNDAHAHPCMTADNMLGVDLSPETVSTESKFVATLGEAAKTRPKGDWIRASRYDQDKTTAGTIVDRWTLDRIVPDHPLLIIHIGAHWGVLNSAALREVGYTNEYADPPGGSLGRDSRGELTGVVFEQALFDVAYQAMARGGETLAPPHPLEQQLRGLQSGFSMFHSAGITSVTDALSGPGDLTLLQEARRRGDLSMRVNLLMAFPHLDSLAKTGFNGQLGDEWLRISGIKGFIDGACAGGNCLVVEPFEGTQNYGMQVMEAETVRRLLAQCEELGLPLAMHANGDRALKLLMEVYREVLPAGGSEIRHRLEHCSLIDDGILGDIRDLGLSVVPFAGYARYHGEKLRRLYGEDRLDRLFAHRAFLDYGIPVAGSSDFPCGPVDVLSGIASCVGRRTPEGAPVGLSQRITVDEAIRMYTIGSAYASGEESVKGRLAPGFLADWAELDSDPYQLTSDGIAEIKVSSTWVGGKPVYRR